MTPYKHTQIGYLMLVILLAVVALFVWMYLTAAAEPPSYDSGTNLLVTAVMALIVLILASFSTLTVRADAERVAIKFGYGIFRKTFAVREIASVAEVKNHWYYGWGIRLWFWPYLWLFSVSGFDAVELRMKNGRIYRIGTDEPEKLANAIRLFVGSS